MSIRDFQLGLVIILFLSSPVCFSNTDTFEKSMHEILLIARAIQAVQPRLEESKYLEYGMGIFRASKRYQIPSSILIAITQQESSFREGLAEGEAGEIGITQVLKRWLDNDLFSSEFQRATKKSMRKPANGFLYSAWILKELKKSEAKGALPYWSYYNARKFKNRFKYFLRVNRHLSLMKRKLECVLDPLQLALLEFPKPMLLKSTPPTAMIPVKTRTLSSNLPVSTYKEVKIAKKKPLTPQAILLKTAWNAP